MAIIVTCGCFDLFHQGHRTFLLHAKFLGHDLRKFPDFKNCHNKLIVAVNSDASAIRLKVSKWGENYPRDSYAKRHANVAKFADEVVKFDTESQLWELIDQCKPCILCKGPDYLGKAVTGDDLAPVIILETPELQSVKEMKRKIYLGE